METGEYKEIVNADHPDGDSSFIKLFLAGDQCDVRKKQSCCDWQNDLAPQRDSDAGSFHTDKPNAGHCRADHAQRHHPGQ